MADDEETKAAVVLAEAPALANAGHGEWLDRVRDGAPRIPAYQSSAALALARGVLSGDAPMSPGPTCHVCGNPKQAMHASATRGAMGSVASVVYDCVTCCAIPVDHPAGGEDVARGWLEGMTVRSRLASPPSWARLASGDDDDPLLLRGG